MSIQPAILSIELPDNCRRMEVCIGFSWGGDATKEVARADVYAFKDSVLAAFKEALADDRCLMIAMADESSPRNGQYRYCGGRTSEKAQTILAAAVESATEQVQLSRPCCAVIVEG